jgi:dTDP-4-amino-4,6-dideoxygalactose transaminase
MSGGVLGFMPTLSPLSLSRRRSQLPYPLQELHLTLSAWGRQGLALGLAALGIGSGDEVLAPAYHHGSEIEAIIASGARCRFYGGNARLEPEPDELERLLGPRVRALHLTHFLGFPQDVERWRSWCSGRGLLLLEDAAQGWLSEREGRPLGSVGDLAIFCLYKSVPVPDGAAMVCRRPVEVNQQRAAGGLLGAAKLAAQWAVQRRLLPAALLTRRRSREFDPAAAFALGEIETPPSRASSALLRWFDFGRVRERRGRNYRRLLEGLGERVAPPFEQLPDGACPWVFPLTVADKQGFLEHLRSMRITGLDFWSISHPAFDDESFPAIAERRSSTVGLPVHQELSDRDIDRITAAASSWRG